MGGVRDEQKDSRMNGSVTWYAARAGGIVAWSLATASVVLGVLLSSGLFRRRSRAWQLDLHRYLGGLAVVFAAGHVLAILADSYVDFGVADVLVPFVASWHPLAVACGVVAFYLLVAVQVTSLLRDRLPRRVWRGAHWASFALFVLATAHGVTAGTDTGGVLAIWVSLTAFTLVGVLVGARLVRSGPRPEPVGEPTPLLPRELVAAGRPRRG